MKSFYQTSVIFSVSWFLWLSKNNLVLVNTGKEISHVL